MTIEELWMPVLLINAVIALAYLLAGCLIAVPTANRAAKAAKKEEKDSPLTVDAIVDEYSCEAMSDQPQNDNRRTYFMRFLIMLLCPVVGWVYFSLGHLCYLLVFHAEVDLSDVIFRKDRSKARLKADEERERNIISLEEGLAICSQADLRQLVLSIVQEDVSDSLAAISKAITSEDSEVAHYAASVLQGTLNGFRLRVQKMRDIIDAAVEAAEPYPAEYGILLVDYIDSVAQQHIFDQYEQKEYVELEDATAEELWQAQAEALTAERCLSISQRLIEEHSFDRAQIWCWRMNDRWPDLLDSRKCELRLTFESGHRKEFLKKLEQIQDSGFIFDSETLELIRLYLPERSRRRQEESKMDAPASVSPSGSEGSDSCES